MKIKEEYTVKDAAEKWLYRCKQDDLEKATLRAYESHFRIHIEPRLGHIKLNELTGPVVRDFLDDLQTTISRSMTKKVLTSLRAVLQEALSRGMVDMNVASSIKPRRGRRHEKERIIPTKTEIRLLLEKAPSKHKPLIATMIFTGMRASEARGLTWDHVDLERKVIQVRQRADENGEMGNPKSSSGRRDIPMTPMLVTELSRWQKVCPTGSLNLAFPNGAGNVESHANIYNRVFKPLMTSCGIIDDAGKPLFTIHALRHAAASLLIDQGWQPKKIQMFMGHSTITMTYDVYGHLFTDASDDVDKMADLERDLLAA